MLMERRNKEARPEPAPSGVAAKLLIGFTSPAMSSTELKPYVVRLDGMAVEEHESHVDALASARDLKESAPIQVVTVVDIVTGETVIVEA